MIIPPILISSKTGNIIVGKGLSFQTPELLDEIDKSLDVLLKNIINYSKNVKSQSGYSSISTTPLVFNKRKSIEKEEEENNTSKNEMSMILPPNEPPSSNDLTVVNDDDEEEISTRKGSYKTPQFSSRKHISTDEKDNNKLIRVKLGDLVESEINNVIYKPCIVKGIYEYIFFYFMLLYSNYCTVEYNGKKFFNISMLKVRKI